MVPLDKKRLYQAFIAKGKNMHCAVTSKEITPKNINGEIVMRVPTHDGNHVCITKEQAMNFFGLVEPEQCEVSNGTEQS